VAANASGIEAALKILKNHLRSDADVFYSQIFFYGNAYLEYPVDAKIRIHVTAADVEYLREAVEKVKECVTRVSSAIGAEVKITRFAHTYYNMVPNQTLAEVFLENLEELGEKAENFSVTAKKGLGLRTDFANISHVVPSICSIFPLHKIELIPHTPEFAEALKSRVAHDSLVTAAKALAMVAVDLFMDPKLLERIKKEYALRLKVMPPDVEYYPGGFPL